MRLTEGQMDAITRANSKAHEEALKDDWADWATTGEIINKVIGFVIEELSDANRK
jgi:hypothetical protein